MLVLGVTLGWVAHHALTGVARMVLETSLPAASTFIAGEPNVEADGKSEE